MKKYESFIEKSFINLTAILSVLLCLLYLWKGLNEGFNVSAWIVIGLNLIYVPLAFIFKDKIFSYYYAAYGLILVFLLAFDKSYLYNNYSALAVILLVSFINSKLRKISLPAYLICCSGAFIFNEETVYHFLIHIIRAAWLVLVFEYAVIKNTKTDSEKSLVLYDDEIKILNQLCEKNIYQKQVEGFSENTVYRKIKSARERNGNISREELMEKFKTEYLKENDNGN